MSARDEILGRVRTALVSADRGPVAVSRAYRARTATDLVALFEGRVADYEATVRTVGPDGVESAIADVLAGARAVVPPALPWNVVGALVDDGLTAAELDDLDAVVTAARVGIA